jgi:hypothetical protein
MFTILSTITVLAILTYIFSTTTRKNTTRRHRGSQQHRHAGVQASSVDGLGNEGRAPQNHGGRGRRGAWQSGVDLS